MSSTTSSILAKNNEQHQVGKPKAVIISSLVVYNIFFPKLEDIEIIQSKSYTLCFWCSHKDNLSAGDDASVLSLSKSVWSSARLFWLKNMKDVDYKADKKVFSSRFHYKYLMQKYHHHQCMGECLIYHEKHKISKGLRAYYRSISIHIVCPHNK